MPGYLPDRVWAWVKEKKEEGREKEKGEREGKKGGKEKKVLCANLVLSNRQLNSELYKPKKGRDGHSERLL